MGFDGPGDKKPEEVKAGQPDTRSKAKDSKESQQSNLDLVQIFGGPAIQVAKVAANVAARAAYDYVKEKALEATLPALLVAVPPSWTDPKKEINAARGLFAVGSDALKLAERKFDPTNNPPPLSDDEDAALKAYWLFRRKGTAMATTNDDRGFELARRDFSPAKNLDDNEKMELAVLTIKTLQERHGGKEPPNRPSRWEQLDERAEFNNAFDVIAKRLKWSEVRAGKSNNAPLDEPITDKKIRKEADEVHYGILYRRYTDLKIPEDRLAQFAGGKLTGGKFPTDEVIAQDGYIEKDKSKADALHRNGQALTRDDAINVLILRSSTRQGLALAEQEANYNEWVTDAAKNPIVTAHSAPINIDLGLNDNLPPRGGGAAAAAGGGPAAPPGMFDGVIAFGQDVLDTAAAWGSTGLKAGALAAVAIGLHDARALVAGKKTWSRSIANGVGYLVGRAQSDQSRMVTEVTRSLNEFELGFQGYGTDRFERYRNGRPGSATPATADDFTQIANELDRQATALESRNSSAATSVRGLVARFRDFASGTATPTRSPRGEVWEHIRNVDPTARPRLPSIVWPLVAAAGLGGEPTNAQAEAAPRIVANAQTARHSAEALEGHETMVRPEGVRTVSNREIGQAEIRVMGANRATLASSRNSAEQAAGDKLGATIEALEGRRGPTVEAAARSAIAEQAGRLSERGLRGANSAFQGLEMLSLAALEAYRYWNPDTEQGRQSAESERAKISGNK